MAKSSLKMNPFIGQRMSMDRGQRDSKGGMTDGMPLPALPATPWRRR